MATPSIIAITRLVLVLSATAGSHIAFTSPQPRATSTETKGYKSTSALEFILSSMWPPIIAKSVTWLVAMKEIFLIAPVLFQNGVPGSSPTAVELTPGFALGTSLALSGGLLRWLCYRALGRHFTFQLTIKNNHTLVKDGPYSVVRHPGYTAFLTTFLGMLTWYLSESSWTRGQIDDHLPLGFVAFVLYAVTVGFVAIGMVTRLPVEDSTLRTHFGKEWDEWALVAQWRLFPGIY